MKIGLLTLPIETGYGGIMQAFALKSALTERGHEVILIRRMRQKKVFDIKRILRRTIKKFVFGKWDTIIFIDKKEKQEFPYVTQNTQKFVDKYLKPYSHKYYSSKEMIDIMNLGIDAVVVGSDQVWRPECMDHIEDYYLCFLGDASIKRYAYAASFGIGDWGYSDKETACCKKAVQKFEKVSVREKSGVSLCKDYLDVEAEFVLDPTLLFDKDFYLSHIGQVHDPNKEHAICAFILDRTTEKQTLLDKISDIKNQKYFFAANNTEDRQAPLEDRIAPSVESWIDSFNSADVVFTDSFHGCVFSIIFRKEFYVYVNKVRGAERFDSLLGMLGLENRMVDLNTQLQTISPIDWVKVEKKLKAMQDISNRFLNLI